MYDNLHCTFEKIIHMWHCHPFGLTNLGCLFFVFSMTMQIMQAFNMKQMRVLVWPRVILWRKQCSQLSWPSYMTFYHSFILKCNLLMSFHCQSTHKRPRWQSSWGQHGAHLGPVGPRWAPCWSHKPCYQGVYCSCFMQYQFCTVPVL